MVVGLPHTLYRELSTCRQGGAAAHEGKCWFADGLGTPTGAKLKLPNGMRYKRVPIAIGTTMLNQGTNAGNISSFAKPACRQTGLRRTIN